MNNSAMGGDQWANQKRRAAFALVGLEHPMDAGGEEIPETEPYYNDERTEATRAANAHIDPNYTAVRRARGQDKVSSGAPRSSTFEDISERLGSAETAARSNASDVSAQMDLAENLSDIVKSGEVSAGEGSAAHSFGEGESYEGRHAGFAGTTGFAHTGRGSFDDRRNSLPDYELGVRLMRTAGRCNHPRCQLIREKGMELTGVSGRFAGVGIESNQPEIPSIPVDKKYYGKNPLTGKDNRSDIRIERSYKPADKNHPEWASMQQGGVGESFYDPSDLLQHHHFEGDADFERYPLPWDM